MSSHFAVLSVGYEITAAGVKLTVITNTACHLWMRWSRTPWDVHLHTELVRGYRFREVPYYCLVAYEDNEQAEAGDTTTHTFTKEPWASCETRYFYFWGEIGGIPCPSESALFQYHRIAPPWGPPVTVRFYPDAHVETHSVDGYVRHAAPPSTWAFLVGAAGNFADSDSGILVIGYLSYANPGEWWVLARSIALFNTLSLPAVCLLNSAKIALKTQSIYWLGGGLPTFNIFSSNPASDITLIPADYATCGSTPFSAARGMGDFVVAAYTDFELNAAGLANITKAGISKFSIREESYDVSGSDPPWVAAYKTNYWRPYSADDVLANKPYLEVTYQEPA